MPIRKYNMYTSMYAIKARESMLQVPARLNAAGQVTITRRACQHILRRQDDAPVRGVESVSMITDEDAGGELNLQGNWGTSGT